MLKYEDSNTTEVIGVTLPQSLHESKSDYTIYRTTHISLRSTLPYAENVNSDQTRSNIIKNLTKIQLKCHSFNLRKLGF